MTDYVLTDKEKNFIQLLKSRKKESESNDNIFCVLLAAINPDEDGEEFLYLDKGFEFAESHPEACIREIYDFIISLRPIDGAENNKEAV